MTTGTLSERDRLRLRWRARRGMLENDLIITRFLDAHETRLTDEDVAALTALLELSDNDLLDLLLGRKEPSQALDTATMRGLLQGLRSA
ncbi:succinate dehydrogenase assembly factor 2 [Achromobacter sp. GG226]|uniref:succinate dehydrogenase assembly factor 2 n=1 Tax=Verticiella alkaliphila TaxID=2779529 RepID=UPI001C0D5EBD|nr:succinate dehydrogenase assembly factor 2 [Verticiella sp. GG226]MBU4612266.1 succinate dehydrogenase assembly factor 2 [Verticiella sp. GG226]